MYFAQRSAVQNGNSGAVQRIGQRAACLAPGARRPKSIPRAAARGGLDEKMVVQCRAVGTSCKHCRLGCRVVRGARLVQCAN